MRSALLADPGLSERQKQVLIEIYESFRKENAVAVDHDAPFAVLPYAGPAGIEPGLAEAEAEAEALAAPGRDRAGAGAGRRPPEPHRARPPARRHLGRGDRRRD